MFGRLLKYDLLALGRVLLPLQACIFGFCVCVTGYSTLRMRASENSLSNFEGGDSSLATLLDSLVSFGVLLLIAIILAGTCITLFLIARHFYFNLYSDEGYLTMTLPATTSQHIAAKTVSGFIWLMINSLVMILSVGIVLIFGMASEGIYSHEAVRLIGDVFQAISKNGPLLFLLYPLSLIVGLLSYLLRVYACLSAGCAWAKKHRVALAVLLIFGVSVALGAITSLADTIVTIASGYDLFTFGENATQDFYQYYLITSLVHLGIDLILIVAYCAFIHHTLSHRLNLE
jgi:hypothetical protein